MLFRPVWTQFDCVLNYLCFENIDFSLVFFSTCICSFASEPTHPAHVQTNNTIYKWTGVSPRLNVNVTVYESNNCGRLRIACQNIARNELLWPIYLLFIKRAYAISALPVLSITTRREGIISSLSFTAYMTQINLHLYASWKCSFVHQDCHDKSVAHMENEKLILHRSSNESKSIIIYCPI